jgi:hypothetical protein
MKAKSQSKAGRTRPPTFSQLLRRGVRQLAASVDCATTELQRLPDRLADALELQHIPDYLTHPDPGNGASLAVQGCSQTHSYTCGAVAAWMVVQAIWPRRQARSFYRTIAPHPETGTSTTRLIAALRQARVGVSRQEPDYAAIVQAIDAGFPIIACIDRPGEEYDHWVVVYGYGRRPRTVYIAGNRWEWRRGLTPNVLPYGDFKRLCTEKLLVCFGRT